VRYQLPFADPPLWPASAPRPKFEEPVGGQILADRQGLRVIAPRLLAHPVAEPVAFLLQLFGHARPLAQLDDHRVLGRKRRKQCRSVRSESESTYASRRSSLAPATVQSRTRSSCFGFIA
jgi:hypothetical protein